MQRSRRCLLLLLCAAVLIALCICTIAAEGKPAAASTPSASKGSAGSKSAAPSSTGSDAQVRARAAERDRKIEEKRLKKEREAAAKEEQAQKEAAAEAKKKAAKAAAATKAAEAKQAAAAQEAAAAKARKAPEKPATAAAASNSYSAAAATPAAEETASATSFSNDDDSAAESSPAAIARKAQAAADAKARLAARKKDPAYQALAKKQERREKLRAAAQTTRSKRLEAARKRNIALAAKRKEARTRAAERSAKRRTAEDARRKKRAEALKPEIIARGLEKRAWFHRTVANQDSSKNGRVVDISYNDFKKYVHASPRPYHLFVVFTALADRYKCALCNAVAPEIRKLAGLFWEDELRAERERKANGTSSTGNGKGQAANATAAIVSLDSDLPGWDADSKRRMPLYFVQVDIEKNGEVFRALDMQSAPTMILLPPTAAAAPGPLPGLLTSIPSKNKYVLMRGDTTANDLNEFINKVVGRSVSLSMPRAPGLAGWIALGSSMLNLMDPVRYLLLCVASAMLCLLLLLWSVQQCWRALGARRARLARESGIVSRPLSEDELAPLRVFSQYASEFSLLAEGTPSLTRSSGGVCPPEGFLKPRRLGLFRWWFVAASCLVYLFGISGGMYNIR